MGNCFAKWQKSRLLISRRFFQSEIFHSLDEFPKYGMEKCNAVMV